ncbi:MAG: tetratricopeptide repeat protein [Mucilaginibacter sp.]|uniref:tetratricopeptide repeat protein n=1 Tax=Mucilaginibacter sp. TaxID=1882438 RepID=UPI003264269F
MGIKPVHVALLVCMLLFCLPDNGALAADTANVFHGIKDLPKQARPAKAMDIYKSNFRKVDSASVMRKLDELVGFAQRDGDKQLEAAVFEMRADYFSVNRGFNSISTSYYQKAIDFALANNMTADVGIYQHKMGLYYYTYRRSVDACKYFLKAQDVFRSVGFDKVPNISAYLTQEASFYYDLGDYENAMLYLKEALKYPISFPRTKIGTINTMGLIYRNNKEFEQALSCFNAALKLSKDNKDTAWVAISTGNIGSVYFMQGHYSEALPFITTDYTTSLKYGEGANAAHALLRLAKISLVNRNLNQAGSRLSEVEKLIQVVHDGLKLKIEYYALKAELSELEGKLAESIAYLKSMEQAKDSLQQRNNVAAVERTKLGWEMANHQVLINQLKTDAELGALKRNAIIMVLFFLIVISLLIYNQQLLKVKKDKSKLITEKKQVDEELKNAESELLLYTESIRKKNVVIENFRKEIDRLETKVVNRDEAEHLEKMMQAHIMTDENWDEFKVIFSRVHAGFLLAIKKNFPGLSGTDTRILTLMKLQLSNREMANMLGITTDGIKKAKQRLRKKMGLQLDADMEHEISKL